ncbi:cell wall hydrolase [uncultured Brevundimonas sp.]|uniref:cell wall hydrolase n=1 Tax=uncultured Brevundimonas sp. TaxID=213418 RepID=UPI00345718D3
MSEGQAAVAQVVLNRMRHPAYPGTVCGVVFQGSERATGCQFSFTCDGAMARTPSVAGWARARASASAALNGAVMAAVGTATHYHTDWVAPYWAERLTKVRQLGTHIFYRWNGGWGLPAAFTSRYGGPEPVPAQMAALSSPVEIPEPVLLTVIFEEPVEDLTLTIPIVEAVPTPAAAEPEAVASTPVVEPPPPAAAPMMADPLAQPGPRPQRRSRIATPSGW